MKESQSLTNNLLMEVEVLSNRLRNIKQSYKTTENKALRERLFSENKNIFKRVNPLKSHRLSFATYPFCLHKVLNMTKTIH